MFFVAISRVSVGEVFLHVDEFMLGVVKLSSLVVFLMNKNYLVKVCCLTIEVLNLSLYVGHTKKFYGVARISFTLVYFLKHPHPVYDIGNLHWKFTLDIIFVHFSEPFHKSIYW